MSPRIRSTLYFKSPSATTQQVQ